MLYYCKPREGNFGDDLNPWLWSRLAPEVCDPDEAALFLGIGTLLSHKVPKDPFKVVFGSGYGGGAAPAIDHRWSFYAARGPLTIEKLNLDGAKPAIGDPAILIRQFVPPQKEKKFRVAFMPHHQSLGEADWESLCAQVGLHCINPRRAVEQVLAEIGQTELLLTEALHGAIVADSLRVPWIPVRLYGNFLEFKWLDWTRSLDLPFTISDVPPLYTKSKIGARRLLQSSKKILATAGLGKRKWNYLRTSTSTDKEIDCSLRALHRLAEQREPCLSQEKKLRYLESGLMEKLAALRQDWKGGQFRFNASASSGAHEERRRSQPH